MSKQEKLTNGKQYKIISIICIPLKSVFFFLLFNILIHCTLFKNLSQNAIKTSSQLIQL